MRVEVAKRPEVMRVEGAPAPGRERMLRRAQRAGIRVRLRPGRYAHGRTWLGSKRLCFDVKVGFP